MSVANVQILYKRVELAVEQPRLYVFQFFEDLRNQIDIVYQMALDDSNEEMMLEQQAELREKVKEVESYCMERIVEAVKEDRDGEMRLTFGQIEADLKREDILKGELERMREFYWMKCCRLRRSCSRIEPCFLLRLLTKIKKMNFMIV